MIEGLYVIVTTWRAFFHSFDVNRGKFVLSEQIRTLPGNRGAVTTFLAYSRLINSSVVQAFVIHYSKVRLHLLRSGSGRRCNIIMWWCQAAIAASFFFFFLALLPIGDLLKLLLPPRIPACQPCQVPWSCRYKPASADESTIPKGQLPALTFEMGTLAIAPTTTYRLLRVASSAETEGAAELLTLQP